MVQQGYSPADVVILGVTHQMRELCLCFCLPFSERRSMIEKGGEVAGGNGRTVMQGV